MDVNKKIITALQRGGVFVLPTDTIYGVVGSALKKETVERIYKLRGRDRKKPMIVLIADIKDLKLFSIDLIDKEEQILGDVWPGPVSVVLACSGNKFEYLHRGGGTIAFRLPNNNDLRRILRETGPLVAPSANTEGDFSAETIKEARQYFGDLVDGYIDEGEHIGKSSRVIALNGGNINVLRE